MDPPEKVPASPQVVVDLTDTSPLLHPTPNQPPNPVPPNPPRTPSTIPLINIQEDEKAKTHWEHAEQGSIIFQENATPDPHYSEKWEAEHLAHALSELPATAISGNDITSSCLYVAGLAAASGGKFAPIALFMVVFVLWLFRGVYSEVGTALPLNGGAYNILLNTTTKTVASLAACLTVLSYVATAVVSGSEATAYLHDLAPVVNPLWATPALLFLFCLLNLIGITESSRVAVTIFLIHCTTMLILIVLCTRKAFETGWVMLIKNWDSPPIISIPADIFYGFCSGLLGVSGFETSANFIEEQKPGVFPKTLRNMWIAVAFFNPIISLLSLAMVPLYCDYDNPNNCIQNTEVQRVLLSAMGDRASGRWLSMLVSADAALVLAGAVLTSYVGIVGLVRRMALDRFAQNSFQFVAKAVFCNVVLET